MRVNRVEQHIWLGNPYQLTVFLVFEDERRDTSHVVVICDGSVVIHVNLHQFERIVVVELVSDVVLLVTRATPVSVEIV
jgi:hypothetical protein